MHSILFSDIGLRDEWQSAKGIKARPTTGFRHADGRDPLAPTVFGKVT